MRGPGRVRPSRSDWGRPCVLPLGARQRPLSRAVDRIDVNARAITRNHIRDSSSSGAGAAPAAFTPPPPPKASTTPHPTGGPLAIMGVHHHAVICRSLETSLAFYQGLLSLQENPDRPDDR